MRVRLPVVLSLLCIASWASAAAARVDVKAKAAGVSDDWLAKVLGEIRSTQYLVQADGDALRSENLQQGFVNRFGPSGLRVSPLLGQDPQGSTPTAKKRDLPSFQWQTEFFGRPGALVALSPVAAEGSGDCVAYEHGDLVEWYVNEPSGIEQAFGIKERPASNEQEEVVIVSAPFTGLYPRLTNKKGPAAQLIEFADDHGQVLLTYGQFKVHDATGKALQSQMRVKDHRVILAFDDSQAAYPVTLDPVLSSVSAWLPVGQAASNFGYSVASAGDINGDGYADAIVGTFVAPGSAYVFMGSAGGLSTVAAWSETGTAGADFGSSVASAGDVNGDGYGDVVVGAYQASGTSGTASVFLGSAGGLATTAFRTLTGTANSWFGSSVACAGDVNGDGYSDIIIGADGGAGTLCAAFVYLGSAAGTAATAAWGQTGTASSQYGYSVASAGDVNGDGYSDVVVGAHLAAASAGAAYVYLGGAGGLATAAAWSRTGTASSEFGASVASAGDVNADGYAELFVGAWKATASKGAAYVYMGSAGGPATSSAWSETGTAASFFGESLASAGDVNGDGYGDAIVGAYGASSNAGAAYLYLGGPGGLNPIAIWSITGTAASDLGISVASAGDVDGDGHPDVIVGAYGSNAAFLYNGSSVGLALSAAWSRTATATSSDLGYSVASAGDVNGDGYGDVIVGAATAASTNGTAYVFLGSAAGLAVNAAWTVTGTAASDRLGNSVASAGDINGDGYGDVIVGAYNSAGTNGSAYVFMGGAGGLATSAAWSRTGTATAGFANTVASAGDVNGDGYSDVIVGAPYTAAGGSAYVFLGGAGGLATAAAWSRTGTASTNYGFSVASAGDVNGDGFSDVIVGADLGAGSAYVYHGALGGLSTAAAWSVTGVASTDMGYSVASAGDVNGDGYSDVIVGAPGVSAAGSAYLFQGSSGGLATVASWSRTGTAGIQFGDSVASAGDINGDGFSDVIIGANFASSNAGAAFLFTGASGGLATVAAWSATGTASSQFGSTVASAGDVNGDGYGDVIIGAPLTAPSNTGAAFLYYGNGSAGQLLAPKQIRGNSALLIPPLGLSNPGANQANLGLAGYSPQGRVRAKMQAEVKAMGQGFNGVGLQVTGSYVDIGGLGTAQTLGLNGLGTSNAYRWRERYQYDPSQTGDGALYSHWFYPNPAAMAGNPSFRTGAAVATTPTFTPTASFTATPSPTATRTSSATASPSPSPTFTPNAGGCADIFTYAGNGGTTYSGDNGQATSASFAYSAFGIFAISTDASNNVYVADVNAYRIRKINAITGVITTVAGTGSSVSSGDGGLATSAGLNTPWGIYVEPTHNFLYIAETYAGKIRKVDLASGVITTVAGTGASYGDGGQAIQAQLNGPYGVYVDPALNIFIADGSNNNIRKVNGVTGIISTFAGSAATTAGYSGNGGLATAALLSNPQSVVGDALGNIYISDYQNNAIRKVDHTTLQISTIAGNGTSGYTGDGGLATSAEISVPSAAVMDGAGNLFIADTGNSVIRKVDPGTGFISTIAGSTFGFSGDNGLATAAKLNGPQGICLDGNGTMFISDAGNKRVRKIPCAGAPAGTPTVTPTITVSPTSSNTANGTFTITPTFSISPTSTTSPTPTTTSTPQNCSIQQVGYTTVGGSTFTDGGYLDAAKIVMPGSGTVVALSMNFTIGGQFQVALYNSSGAKPNILLASSGIQTGVPGWNLVPIAPTAVSAGNYYLVFQVDNAVAIAQDLGVSGDDYYISQAWGAFPGTFPTGTAYNAKYSAYASLCVAFTPSPTSTRSSSSTPSPTVTATCTVSATLSATRTVSPTPTFSSTLSVSPSPTSTTTPCALDVSSTVNLTLNSGVYNYCSVWVHSGGILTIFGAVTFNVTGDVRFDGNLNGINGSNGGLTGSAGTGPGPGGVGPAGTGGGGGGHAGVGGAGGGPGGSAGGTYDSPANPTQAGSGGGGGFGASQLFGGSGGASLVILAGGDAHLNGNLDVSGTFTNVPSGPGQATGGGGGGGTFSVSAVNIDGAGAILASGGSGGNAAGFSGDNGGGGGGGGFIRLCASGVYGFGGTTSVLAGNGGTASGGGLAGQAGAAGQFSTCGTAATASPTKTPTASPTTTLTTTPSGLTGDQWALVSASTNIPARRYAGMVTWNNKLWVMGGANCGATNYNDVWSSADGASWTASTLNAAWGARRALGAVVFNNRLWVIGGYDGVNNYNDVWSSTDGVNWNQEASAAFTQGIRGMGCAVFNNEIWVVAGHLPGATYSNEVWHSADGITWSQVTSPSVPFIPRELPGMAVMGPRLYLAAGSNGGNQSDVWSTADGTNWSQDATNAFPARNSFPLVSDGTTMYALGGGIAPTRNDVWATTSGSTWNQLTGTAQWAARYGHGAAFLNSSIYLFGGQAASCKNDVWVSPLVAPTATVTPTFSASATASPSSTASPTLSVTASPTASPSFSASPTFTPLPSATPTPSGIGALVDMPVFDGQVNAILTAGNLVYVGGYFANVGQRSGGGVPLDAGTGTPVTGFPQVLGTVFAATPDGNGGWYIGGNFTYVAGTPRTNLAHILANLSLDPNWAPSANLQVRCLAVAGNQVYIGGFFTSVNAGIPRNHLAAVDRVTGVASAWDPNLSSNALAMATDGMNVYVGGSYTTVNGGATRNNLAAFDAATGLVSSWNPNMGASVTSLALSGSTLYAGGLFATVNGGTSRSRLAAIDTVTGNATAWDPNVNGTVSALALSGSVLYAGGSFTTANSGAFTRNRAAAFDLSSAAALAWDPNSNGAVSAIEIVGTTVYLGGSFTTVNGATPRTRLAAVDGSTGVATAWDPSANGTASQVMVLSAIGTRVFAGGTFFCVGPMVARNGIAAIDATTGLVTSFDPNAPNVDCLALNGTTLYAGGIFTSVSGGTTRNRVASFNTTTGAVTGWDPNSSQQVKALAVSGSTVYIGGLFTAMNGGTSRKALAAVDASTGLLNGWDPAATGSTGYVAALAVQGSTVYAGGSFLTVNGSTSRNGLAALDATTGFATSWDPNLNSPGAVLSLALNGTTLYVAGSSTTVNGGTTRNRILALDTTTGVATSWDPNSSNQTNAVLPNGGTVYAGGVFTTIGGAARNRIAALDGSTGLATSLDPNANGNVNALALSPAQDRLYLGGNFTGLGGLPQAQFACVLLQNPPPTSTPTPTLTASPSQSPSSTASMTASPSITASPTVVYNNNVCAQAQWGNCAYHAQANSVDWKPGHQVYVGGDIGSTSPETPTLLKYDEYGNLLWSLIYNDGNNKQGTGVAADASDNAYLSAWSNGGLPGEQFVLIKVDASGNTLWTKGFWEGAPHWDRSTGVAVDGNGDVIQSGYGEPYGGGSSYALTVKYDSNGNTLWSQTYGSVTEGGTHVVTDAANNIYISGWSAGSFLLLKYNAAGALQFNKTFFTAGGNGGAAGVALDSVGNIYLTGSFDDGVGGNQWEVVKYDIGGNLVWARSWTGPGAGNWANTIAVGADNGVYVGGSRYSITNWILKKWDTQGNDLWNYQGNDGVAKAIAVNAASPAELMIAGDTGSGCLRWQNQLTRMALSCPPPASPSPTSTRSSTVTVSPTPTATITGTFTPTGTATRTSTITGTFSSTATQTPTITQTFTATATPTFSSTITPTSSNTATQTPTITQTFTATVTPTSTSTVTNTFSDTATQTPTVTQTYTSTVTPTFTSTVTNTFSGTATQTATVTQTYTGTVTPTFTSTVTNTFSDTATQTATVTQTGTATVTPTFTPTITNTGTQTPTITQTYTSSVTPTLTFTITGTFSGTATQTPTITQTFTATVTPTYTSTFTATFSGTATQTATVTQTFTATVTPSSTSTITDTFSDTATHTPSITQTFTVTVTPTFTSTSTDTFSDTATQTPTITQTFTASVTPTHTSTITDTFSDTATQTPTITPTFTATVTLTFTSTISDTFSDTATHTPSITQTFTSTVTPTCTSTITDTFSDTATRTPTITGTFTATVTPTHTSTITDTFSDTATQTPTITQTFTATVTPSFTSTITDTFSDTATHTPSITQTFTATVTPTCTSTVTDTFSDTATQTPTITQTFTVTATPTCTSTITDTFSDTATQTPTITRTFTATVTETYTETLTSTETHTATGTFTYSVTQTDTPSVTESYTSTVTETFTSTVTETDTQTSTGTPTETPTYSATITGTFTSTATETNTGTETSTETPTATGTFTSSVTTTDTPTVTESCSSTMTGTFTPTVTETDTQTSTATPTATPTDSDTITGTFTPTVTQTSTDTVTSTETPTATGTFTSSVTATDTPTVTESCTSTVTGTFTPTVTGSNTQTSTATPTATTTFSSTVTMTLSSTVTETATVTATFSPTATPTSTGTESATATASVTPTGTGTATASATATGTHTPTPSATATGTATVTATQSSTRTLTLTLTATATSSGTPTASASASVTATRSATLSVTPSLSPTGSSTPTPTPSATPTTSPPNSATFSPTATLSRTGSASPTATPTVTLTTSSSATPSVSATSTQTATPTPPSTFTVTLTRTLTPSLTPSFSASPTQTPLAPTLSGNVQTGSGTFVFTGTGQPGATVFIVVQPGNVSLGSGTVAPDGSFAISLPATISAGDSIEAHAGSPAGPVSSPQAAFVAPAGAPAANTDVPDAGATVLTLSGIPGQTVIVVDSASGEVLGQGSVGGNGQAAVFLDQPAAAGHTLDLIVGGLVQDTVVVSAVSGQAASLDPGFVFVEGSTLTGHGVPGAQVQLVDGSGAVLGSTMVGANGTFSLPVSGAQSGASLKLIQNGVARDLTLTAQVLGSNRVFLSKNVFKPEQGGSLDIGFKAEADERVTVRIFNLAGELVRPVAEMEAKAGVVYALSWDGRNAYGESVASGIYFVSAKGQQTHILKKVVVLK